DGTQTHSVPLGSIGRGILIQNAGSYENDNILAINLGEGAKRLHVADPMPRNQIAVDVVSKWAFQLEQAALQSLEHLKECVRVATTGYFQGNEHVWEDPYLAPLAKSLGQLCDMCKKLMAIGQELSMDISPIEKFLIEPITFQVTSMGAVNCSKKIALQYEILD